MLAIDTSASGSGPPITSRSSSPTMVHSSSKLHALGLIYDPHYNCHQPAEDTPQHVLYKVQRVAQDTAGGGANQRCRLASGASFLGNEGRLPSAVVRKYITRVLRLREEEELRRRLQAG